MKATFSSLLISLLLQLAVVAHSQETDWYRQKRDNCQNSKNLSIGVPMTEQWIPPSVNTSLTIEDAMELNFCFDRIDRFGGQSPSSSYYRPILQADTPNLWYSFKGTGSSMIAELCKEGDSELGYFTSVTIYQSAITWEDLDEKRGCSLLECVGVSNIGSKYDDCRVATFSSIADRTYYAMVAKTSYSSHDDGTAFFLQVSDIDKQKEKKNGVSLLASNDICEHARVLSPDTGEFHASIGTEQARPDLNSHIELNCYGPRSFSDSLDGVFYRVDVPEDFSAGKLRVSLCGDADYYAALTVYSGGHITSTSEEVCRFLSDYVCEGEEIRMTYGNEGICDSTYAVEWDARGNHSYVVWVRGRGYGRVGTTQDVVLHIGSSSATVLSTGVAIAASLLVSWMALS